MSSPGCPRRELTDSELDKELSYAIAGGEEYARNVAAGMGRSVDPQPELTGLDLLEVGPGMNAGMLLMCSLFGARISALEKFPARWDPAYHPRIYSKLRERVALQFPHGDFTALDAVLERETHQTAFLKIQPGGLGDDEAGWPDCSFDAIVSNAALEHVENMERAARELARLTRPSGLGIHQVDFRDHLHEDRPLEFLATPDDEYDEKSRSAKRHGHNRLRASEYSRCFRDAGFLIDRFTPNLFAEVEYVESARKRLLPRYASMPVEELCVISGRFFLRMSSS